jgi:hypothetical protein
VSKTDLAEQTGFAPGFVESLLSGILPADMIAPVILQRLAQVLQIAVHELTGTPAPEPPRVFNPSHVHMKTTKRPPTGQSSVQLQIKASKVTLNTQGNKAYKIRAH